MAGMTTEYRFADKRHRKRLIPFDTGDDVLAVFRSHASHSFILLCHHEFSP